MKGIFAALQFLTVARRYRKSAMSPAEIGLGILYFPLVGLGLGLILAGLNYLLERYLESEILSEFNFEDIVGNSAAIQKSTEPITSNRLSP